MQLQPNFHSMTYVPATHLAYFDSLRSHLTHSVGPFDPVIRESVYTYLIITLKVAYDFSNELTTLHLPPVCVHHDLYLLEPHLSDGHSLGHSPSILRRHIFTVSIHQVHAIVFCSLLSLSLILLQDMVIVLHLLSSLAFTYH